MPEPTTDETTPRLLSSFVHLNPGDLDPEPEPFREVLATRLHAGLAADATTKGVPLPPGPVTVWLDPARADDTYDRNVFVFRCEVPLSAEVLRDHGIGAPETPAEAAQRAARAAKYAEYVRLAWEAHDAALAAFAAVQDPALAAVLTLHRPQVPEYGGPHPVCHGCDQNGYESEPPDWPCTTVETIAAVLGVETPTSHRLALTYVRAASGRGGTWQRP